MEKSDLGMEGAPPGAVAFPHAQSVWPFLPHNSAGESSSDRGTYCRIFCIYDTANRCTGKRVLQLSPVRSGHCDAVSFLHFGSGTRLLACFTTWHQQQARPNPAQGCGITYQVSS